MVSVIGAPVTLVSLVKSILRSRIRVRSCYISYDDYVISI